MDILSEIDINIIVSPQSPRQMESIDIVRLAVHFEIARISALSVYVAALVGWMINARCKMDHCEIIKYTCIRSRARRVNTARTIRFRIDYRSLEHRLSMTSSF